MTPERWQKLDTLFHEALALEAEARAAYLAAVCGDDEPLRAEVEQLIAAHECESSFIDEPIVAGLVSDARATSPVGRSIGHYKIFSLLGQGGMGEVFLAEDLILERKVALKLLPAAFTQQPERVRRFEREAKAASALNHPNILTIHEIGEIDNCHYIVSEFIEGETLGARLRRGRLSLSEAIAIARQVASALGVAHEAGIIHRDIKPDNVMVRPDGLVKVLDFGLAKLKPPQLSEWDDSQVSTPKSLTSPGVMIGTVAYMSPEQIRGETIDYRSDLFSFGLLLVEMLQGERAFQRATMAETMTAILNDEPPEMSTSNAGISPQLEMVVRRCLEKEPARRFHSAHDLGFALETLSSVGNARAFAGESGQDVALLPVTVSPGQHAGALAHTGWRGGLGWMSAGLFAVLALMLSVSYLRRPALDSAPLRFAINPPERATLFDWPTISPDGHTLAFIAEVDGKTQLWVRTLSAATARPLVEVRDNLPAPFWSPDSQFIAYFEQGKLRKISLAGGIPEILCDVPGQSSGAWNREGEILIGNGPSGLSRVSADGGAVTAVTTVDTARGDRGHYSPSFLPDGRHFLYWINNLDAAKSGVYLASLDGSENQQLLSRLGALNVGVALNPANQSEGYLAFVRQGALLAQAFDFSHYQLVGNPVRIADYVPAPVVFLAHFSLATHGVLVLQESEPDQQLTWFDRMGKKLGTIGPAGQYSSPRLSLDGQRLVVGSSKPPAHLDDLYLFDVASGMGTPFTFDPKQDQGPLWSPDSSHIVWTSNREGASNLYQKAASGAGQDEVLLRSAFYKSVCDWSADDRFILYEELSPHTAHDLWVLPMTGERKPWLWLSTPAAELAARFSPDGKWIAYQSNESGRIEIYVQAFVSGVPASGSKRQLSTNGGKAPRWRRDGRELCYIAADGKLMAVTITPGAELKAGPPHALFTPVGFQVNADRGYTLTGDGQRFLFVTNAEGAPVPPFTVVLNWMAEVTQ